MPEYVDEIELTQDGMHAIFARMGYGDITSGSIYNGKPTIRVDKLNEQGFMPVLTGVGEQQTSGHWIMLIKGKEDNQYFLFDPLGQTSGNSYQSILAKQLPRDATLSVIPNEPGLNMGLCGYWVASAGLRARQTLTAEVPLTPVALGRTISDEMRGELTADGYTKITGWLRAVAHEFPAGDAQLDATALRLATEKGLHLEKPTSIIPAPKKPTASPVAPIPLDSTLLESDVDVRNTIDYVHKEYLKKPYPGPLKNPKVPEEGRLPPNEGPDRGTHGLAHTVRTMACAEVMVEEARKAKLRGEKLGTAKDGRTLADVTPEELKKILIAQAFFVVGRDDERSGYDEILKRDFYGEYHDVSEKAFRKYVEDNKLIGKIFKDQKEVDFYAAIVKDRPKNWDGTPAHVLIHKGHMVDLMRVKAPQEVTAERCYNSLKDSVGSRGAEVVLKTHREFFLATGAVVPLFNPEAKDDPSRGGPYENPYNGEKYAIEEGKDLKSKKDIRLVDSKHPKKDNERFVTIKEYYALPEVQQAFPGCKTYLEPSSYMVPTPFARTCDENPSVCLGAIQKVRSNAKMDLVKEALQSDSKKDRRKANADEIAAARIIQKILANPDVIQDDHVLLNGQRLEEKFFRELLAKCDMAIVGSLFDDNDIVNVDRLTLHEKSKGTEFHSTAANAPKVKIGEMWAARRKNRRGDLIAQIKLDLISQMQSDAWYYSRVNAIAQNRDKDSTFKEVVITTLMTPLTSRALVDTHGKLPSPKRLYRGFSFPEDFKNKLIDQANTIIANSTKQAFTDTSAQAFLQIKVNDLSKINCKTNVSNSTNIELTRAFGSDTIFEIYDPESLLQSKQVGTHGAGTEDEFSFYLPEDVVLVPIKVTPDGKATVMQDDNLITQDRHIITFVAVKSPDFLPRHQSGFAVDPLFKMQIPKVTKAIEDVKAKADDSLNDKLVTLRVEMVKQTHLPIRGGFLDKVLHYFSGKDDQKISAERKELLEKKVIPLLQK